MGIRAGIFDLDGVITDTAKVHFYAWKQTFDDFLRIYCEKHAKIYHPFSKNDYLTYVDGKPRIKGILSFLHSRNINIPSYSSKDDETSITVTDLAERKQKLFLQTFDKKNITVFSSTIQLIHELHKKNIKTAVVSSSKNCQFILNKAGISDLFHVTVDGLLLKKLNLAGKPEPDMYLEAAKRLHVSPSDAFIVEDSIAGILAGQAGDFGLVIGVDRTGNRRDVYFKNGADLVVNDLSEITINSLLKGIKLK